MSGLLLFKNKECEAIHCSLTVSNCTSHWAPVLLLVTVASQKESLNPSGSPNTVPGTCKIMDGVECDGKTILHNDMRSLPPLCRLLQRKLAF
jgi:hypothetical protein